MNIQEQEKNIFLNNVTRLSQKELILTIKELITTEFQKYLNIAGLDYITEFYSIDRKKEILNNIQKQLQENNPKEIQEHFDNFYYKILKEQEKIYKLNDIYLQNKQIEAEIIPEPKKQNNFLIILFYMLKYLFYGVLIVGLFPLLLVLLALWAIK